MNVKTSIKKTFFIGGVLFLDKKNHYDPADAYTGWCKSRGTAYSADCSAVVGTSSIFLVTKYT